MAQTTGQMSGAAFTLGAQFGGTGSFTDISGSSQSIEMPELTRKTGEAYTPDAEWSISTFGKIEPFDVKVNVIYTEAAGEAFLLLEAAALAGTLVALKWVTAHPKAGADTITTNAGVITKWQVNGGDASKGDPILCAFTVRCNSYTRTT